MRMVEYKCFQCGKVIPKDMLRNRIRCPFCGCKMLYKPRTKIANVKAR
jgi:DNA-directed RNA polymerase subunit P